MTIAERESSARGGMRTVMQVGLISTIPGAMILLQDAAIAARFGAGDSVDAYQVAMSFPTTAVNVFAGGTLLAVMVPRLVQLGVAGRGSEATALVKQARRGIAWLLVAVCGAWAAAYPFVIRGIAEQFSAATIDLSTRLLWLALPTLVLQGLATVESAVLNSHGRFGLLSALPAFMPAGVALSVLILAAGLGIYAASIGALAGCSAQLLAARWRTAPLLERSSDRSTSRPPLRDFAADYGASAGAAALLGGIVMSDTFMASTLPPGSTATLGFATRPIILLLAFATTTVANVTLPMFSRLAATGDFRTLKRRLTGICGLLVLVAIPLVLTIHFFAPLLVSWLYERGTFTASDTLNVAAVQQVYVWQVPFFLVAMVGWRLMNSLQRNAALLVITAFAFIINLVVDLLLAPRLGLVGIAWGTNAAFASWAVLILGYLYTARPSRPR